MTEEDQLAAASTLITRLTGAQITAVGANDAGELYLCTQKDGVQLELQVGVDLDEDGAVIGVALVELNPQGTPK